MRLSFGLGIVFVPVGLVLSTEYVVAARTGTRLSDVVAGVVLPFGSISHNGASSVLPEDAPGPAVSVSEERESEIIAERPNGTGNRRAAKSGKPPKPIHPLSIYVDAGTVLRIANSGRRPSGRSVTADGQRPAGVQVFGASSLGVGVRDGDVITKVSGVPVTTGNQVIALVIAARGSHQSAISAEVYRGQRKYILTVEQPYLAGRDPPTNADAGVEPSP